MDKQLKWLKIKVFDKYLEYIAKNNGYRKCINIENSKLELAIQHEVMDQQLKKLKKCINSGKVMCIKQLITSRHSWRDKQLKYFAKTDDWLKYYNTRLKNVQG